MEFRDYLKKDLERIGCSLSELSRASGLSSAVISRYRSGERIPRADSEMLIRLCSGLSKLEAEAGLTPMGEERLIRYRAAIGNKPSLLAEHLDELLSTLRLSMKDLSYILNYDASYLSRIRSGKRAPADPVAFADHIARALGDSLRSADRMLVNELTGAESDNDFAEYLSRWLIQTEATQEAEVEHFLSTINTFNLNQYIRSLHFEEQSFTGVPIHDGKREYYDVTGLRQGELDFFVSTLKSDSVGPIYMCNDLPMEEMAKDIEFVKEWMGLIAQCIKKGHQIHIIHDVNRPFPEMMLGLETWIPVYMTGQIFPYYLHSVSGSIYRHCLYVSDVCVLSGEGIGSAVDYASSTLSGDPKRLAYGKARAKQLFGHAVPLMRIIRSPRDDVTFRYMEEECSAPGNWHIRAAVPPYFALNFSLLTEILRLNQSSPDLTRRAETYLISQQDFANRLLRNGSAAFEINALTKSEFERYTPEFDAPFLNPDEHLQYTWETYRKHLSLAKELAATHAGLSVRENADNVFRNLSIYVRDQNLAIVSKHKDPRITFIITHPNIIQAMRQFTAPVIDTQE
jgi:transcriptional regulator with XRE-family HTH domain